MDVLDPFGGLRKCVLLLLEYSVAASTSLRLSGPLSTNYTKKRVRNVDKAKRCLKLSNKLGKRTLRVSFIFLITTPTKKATGMT